MWNSNEKLIILVELIEDSIGSMIDNDKSVFFDSTSVGSPVTKTIKVTNAGDIAYPLNWIHFPSGYSIIKSDIDTIFSGQSKFITIQLDALSAGIFEGNILFKSNTDNEPIHKLFTFGQVIIADEVDSAIPWKWPIIILSFLSLVTGIYFINKKGFLKNLKY